LAVEPQGLVELKSAKDYEGRNVRGKLVLCDGGPAACHRMAVEERGAAGLISYNSNQRTGWWRDDIDLVRWGHLDPRGRANTFAMMISVREAAGSSSAGRGRDRSRSRPRARNDDSVPCETIIATIRGRTRRSARSSSRAASRSQKPAANDNASGCAVDLEIGRVLKLIDEGGSTAEARSASIWPSEMTGDDCLPGEVSGSQSE
jgi:hypothetical protein